MLSSKSLYFHFTQMHVCFRLSLVKESDHLLTMWVYIYVTEKVWINCFSWSQDPLSMLPMAKNFQSLIIYVPPQTLPPWNCEIFNQSSKAVCVDIWKVGVFKRFWKCPAAFGSGCILWSPVKFIKISTGLFCCICLSAIWLVHENKDWKVFSYGLQPNIC